MSSLFLTAFSACAQDNFVAVFDVTRNEKSDLPRNFRDLNSLGINAIASAQFSEKQLLEVRKKYPKEKIIIVDLRAEEHGLINGEAVSWRSVFDQQPTRNLLSDLKNQHKIQISKVSARSRESGWYMDVEPFEVELKSVTSEEDLAKKNGFDYKHFLVRDFDIPDSNQFSEMINFIKNTPTDQKIYVHCAGGSGRTGMFLVLLDILKNGKNSSLKEIFERQSKLGAARLDKISTSEAWTKEIAQKRLKIIKKFYADNRAARTN
jgi:protein-tyrosine phosphatase